MAQFLAGVLLVYKIQEIPHRGLHSNLIIQSSYHHISRSFERMEGYLPLEHGGFSELICGSGFRGMKEEMRVRHFPGL